jgi:sRNA-binding carbon storage regulator CsrA
MLVLERKPGQRVRVFVPLPGGGEVELSVSLLAVRDGERAKIGFEGPTDVLFLRGEVEREAND